MPQVSIIVPTNNVKPYIGQCLDSLVNQTLTDIEIIVVDDGSTDGTWEIIAEYAASHPSVKPLRQEDNRGPGSARNQGIAAASGDYVAFADGDDWADRDMYRQLHQHAVSHQCDLVICNGSRYDQVADKVYTYWSQEEWRDAIHAGRSAPFKAVHNPALFLIEPLVQNRMVRRALLEKIQFKFPIGWIYEDMPQHFEIPLAASAVFLIDKPLYFYRVNRPGQITSWRDDRILHVLPMFEKIDQILNAASPPIEVWAAAMRFQFRNVTGIRRYVDATIGRRLAEGWVATLRQVPAEAIDSFRRHYPFDRFSLHCIRTGRLDWLDRYEKGNLTNEIRRFLLLHPSMWRFILSSLRDKALGIQRLLSDHRLSRD